MMTGSMAESHTQVWSRREAKACCWIVR